MSDKSQDIEIRADYMGRIHAARLRANGRVLLKGQEFGSVSAAGQSIRNRPTDGWSFWKFERNGQWLPISEYRKLDELERQPILVAAIAETPTPPRPTPLVRPGLQKPTQTIHLSGKAHDIEIRANYKDCVHLAL